MGSPKDICTGGEGSQAHVEPLVVVVIIIVINDSVLAIEEVKHGGQQCVNFQNYNMAALVVNKDIVVLRTGGARYPADEAIEPSSLTAVELFIRRPAVEPSSCSESVQPSSRQSIEPSSSTAIMLFSRHPAVEPSSHQAR